MKYVLTILQIVCLLTIYLIGVLIQKVSNLSVPGSIIGMILLFGALHFRFIKREWLSLGSSFLLKYLPMLFIPATVGVIDYLDLFMGSGLITIGIVLVSTIIVMVTSARISDVLLTRGEDASKDKGIHL
ncbi:CidA/LrgA family holin-like protein [Metabacillus sp. BG109]|uniref:CidA/LrgA family holin-like protein n=2 Tax=Metabacillus bambusae TaxID=2795218 RepID=A0ABS3N5P0_9BACI|nr:CidA/LrgA family holin-like protein [Metabacillus bambusae]